MRCILRNADCVLFTDIYRSEPTRRRECLYFLAVGHYKLGNYAEAKRYNGRSPPCPHTVDPQS